MAGAVPTHRDYANPPIIETLCQVTFDAVSWGVAAPGSLWNALRVEYPSEPQAQQQMQAQVAVQGSMALAVNPGAQRVVYSNAKGTRLVIAGIDTLSVNSLPPYEGWKSLRRRFRKAVNAYQEVFGPVTARFVTVKYVNRIAVPIGAAPSDYLCIPIWRPGGGDATPNSVLSRVETSVGAGLDIAATVGTLVQPEGAWLLDLEVRATGVEPGAGLDDLVKVADAAHDAENAEFERSITDACRTLFK